MNPSRLAKRVVSSPEGAPVTPLELFFDLVFAFALSRVTTFMELNLGWHGVLRGMLVLGVLWWSWVCYCWLGNVARADKGLCRPVLLLAMVTMFVLALAIPEAFVDAPGGLPGPLVVALCYIVFRALHLALFWLIAADDVGLRGQLARFTPSMLAAGVLLILAAGLEGIAQTALWAAVLLVDYGGTMLGGASGWRLRSVRHFAERHRRIVIVALGASLVGASGGVAGVPLSWLLALGAGLGLLLVALIWWLYFDDTGYAAERALAAQPDAERPRIARDAYSYLHLPMIAGMVLVALGITLVLAHLGRLDAAWLPLPPVGTMALYGGVALYLCAQVAFVARAAGAAAASGRRIGVGLLVLALMPLGGSTPPVAALSLLILVLGALVFVETRKPAKGISST